MKNKLIVILIAAMFFALQVNAAADIAPVDVKVEHIIISGSLPVWEDTDISLRVYNTGNENETITEQNFFEVVNYQNQIQADETGGFKFEFDMEGDPGEYFFRIEARGYDINYTSSFNFYGKEYINGIFEDIEEAKADSNMPEVKRLIEENADKIQFTAPLYETLKSDSVKIIEFYNKLIKLDKIDGIFTLEKQLEETAALMNIKYAADENTFYELLEEYKLMFGLDENTAYKTLINKSVITDSQRNIVANAYFNADFKNGEEFVPDLEKRVILTGINTAENYGQIRDIIQANLAIIKTTKHQDLQKLKYPDEVYLIIMGNNVRNIYNTLSELANAFDNAVITRLRAESNTKPGNPGGGGTGGGSPGGSTGGGSNASMGNVGAAQSISGSVSKPDNSVKNDIFNDLNGYEWAKDAINDLSKKGIINGMGENRFEPSANVTREQFVKMIVIAFDLKTDETVVNFSDADEDAWYYPYVVSAYANGIISGKSKENFGIGDEITREDMAVILYRLNPGLFTDKEECEFSDKERISEYALEAVSALNNKGIILGMEENIFSPEENATRAQAAVIISRMLDIYE